MANNEFVEPEQCRTVLIAMDASKHSDYAFECKYIMGQCLGFWYLLHRRAAKAGKSVQMRSHQAFSLE